MSFRQMYAELDSVAKHERQEILLSIRFFNCPKKSLFWDDKNSFYLLSILFCLINPSTSLRMLSKNQDLDFQRSITFLIPKTKELFVLFLFLFKGTHESSISLRSNSFSFYGIFKLLTLACKSYVSFRC